MMWMGTKLPHFQEHRGILDGEHQKHIQQNTKNTQTQDAQQQKNSFQIQNA